MQDGFLIWHSSYLWFMYEDISCSTPIMPLIKTSKCFPIEQVYCLASDKTDSHLILTKGIYIHQLMKLDHVSQENQNTSYSLIECILKPGLGLYWQFPVTYGTYIIPVYTWHISERVLNFMRHELLKIICETKANVAEHYYVAESW